MLPYSEVPIGGGNHSSQDFGDPTQLTSADMQQMIDPAAVQKQLSTLLQDPTVSKDYSSQVGSLLSDIGVSSNKADDLYNQITSPGYAQFLQAAKDKGLGDAAQAQVSSDVGALAALDPARAGKASQILLNNGITADINAKFGDPSKISDDALSAASQGIFSAIRSELAADNNVPRTVIGALDSLWDAVNTKSGDKIKLIRALAGDHDIQSGGSMPASRLQDIIDASGITVSEKPKLLASLQTLNTKGILGSISGAISLVGAVYNTVAAAPGVSSNNSSGAEGTKAVAATQAWLGFLSFSNSYVKLSDNLFKSPFLKSVVTMLGVTTTYKQIWAGDGSAAAALKPDPVAQHSYIFGAADPASVNPADVDGAMVVRGKGKPTNVTDPGTGLPVDTIGDQSCIIGQYNGQDVALKADPAGGGRYQILQADGSWSPTKAIYLAPSTDGTQAQFVSLAARDAGVQAGTIDTPMSDAEVQAVYAGTGEHANAEIIGMTDMSGAATEPSASTPAGEGGPDAGANATSLLTEEAAADGVKLPASGAAKLAATIAKTLSYAGDFGGGVAGVVLGALSLKTATTPEEKAVGALGIESGLVGTAAGAAEIASMAGIEVAGVGLVAGIAFAAGAIFAFIGAGIAFAIEHKKESEAAKAQGKFFGDLAGDGLMQSDWTEKLEYARYETHQYSGRDAPAGESIFNFQSAEYAHFLATPQQHGSSQNRLDADLHVHYDSPESDPDYDYDTGLGSGGM